LAAPQAPLRSTTRERWLTAGPPFGATDSVMSM